MRESRTGTFDVKVHWQPFVVTLVTGWRQTRPNRPAQLETELHVSVAVFERIPAGVGGESVRNAAATATNDEQRHLPERVVGVPTAWQRSNNSVS